MRHALPLALAVLGLAACPDNKNTGAGGATGASAASVSGTSQASSATGATVSTSASSVAASSSAASSTSSSTGGGDGGPQKLCDLPGAIQYTKNGVVVVPGGPANAPSLSFLTLPQGFCAHYYGTVPNARQVRVAPGGELFVASPTGITTGGGPGGQAAIIVLPDDDGDGFADLPVTFLSGLPYTQGLLFANAHLYYQDSTKILRVPYAKGDRMAKGASEKVADITYYSSAFHWPKTLDVADDGSIYVGNGGDQNEQCDPAHPFHGGIVKIDAAPGPNPGGVKVAKGLRNPINVRCLAGHDTCFALELAKDYSSSVSGREKLLPIHDGDDWGFPCCATKDVPYGDIPATDCSKVTADTSSFLIGDTPFGMDFDAMKWPAPFTGNAFVVTHGAAGPWTGARMVAIPMDPNTGLPMPSSNINGPNMGMVDFATGWDDGSHLHGRPAAVTFAPDGRLYVANDNNGVIFWIAPL